MATLVLLLCFYVVSLPMAYLLAIKGRENDPFEDAPPPPPETNWFSIFDWSLWGKTAEEEIPLDETDLQIDD